MIESFFNNTKDVTDPATLAISTLNARTANAPRRSACPLIRSVARKFS